MAAILESCGTNIVMNVGSETAAYFEKLIGKQQKKQIDTSHTTAIYSERDSKGVNEKTVIEETILASELSMFVTFEFVFKTIGTNWIHVRSQFEPTIDLYESINSGYIKTDRFKLNAKELVKQQKEKNLPITSNENQKDSQEKEFEGVDPFETETETTFEDFIEESFPESDKKESSPFE